MNEKQITDMGARAKKNAAVELPQVILPGGEVTITESAGKLFRLIAPAHRMFVRGGAVQILVMLDDELLALGILRPAAARSLFEKFARFRAWRPGENYRLVLKPVNCPQPMADALLQSEEALTLLPRVQGLINCPVVREVNGKLGVAGRGYDKVTRLIVTGGKTPPKVELKVAVRALLALLAEFSFQTEGDQARAIASLISPALKTGMFLHGRVPAVVTEADQSQAGKTYLQKLNAAIYNERVSLVTCRHGGVGSIDESLNQALVAGRPFIQFDNFRGRFDSTHLEAFLTAEKAFSCRVRYRGEITVPPKHYLIFLTSNGVDTTRDFANRSNIIRIRKQPPGFVFTKFPEGDLLAHVRRRQAYYLGCVVAVIREWHKQGKPVTDETRHDFRDWVQLVDWICQHLFGTGPVMDRHQQAQEQVSNPALVWLRNVVLAIQEDGALNRALTATDLNRLCDGHGLEIPGRRPYAHEEAAIRVIGTIMARLFRDRPTVEADGFVVIKEEIYVSRANSSVGGSFKGKTYTVTKP
jgi:hypothetical protein